MILTFGRTEEQSSHYDEQQFVALNSRQLKELQGKCSDTIIYANPTYVVPPPTPCGSIHEDDDDGDEIFSRPSDYDLRAEHKYLHKDLRRLLGTSYTGFHIATESSNPEEFFESSNNRSSYYEEPLVEPGRDPNAELTSFINRVDKEFQRADAKANGDYDVEDERYDSDGSTRYEGGTRNVFQPPRSQIPAQAIIIYLLFEKGLHMSKVAEMLGPLEEKFVYKHESRWWNGYRIPQHTQLNDKIVEKVLKVRIQSFSHFERSCQTRFTDYVEISGFKRPAILNIADLELCTGCEGTKAVVGSGTRQSGEKDAACPSKDS